MPKERSQSGSPTKGRADHTDNRVAQRHQKQSRAGQLSTANAEESPHMDRGDSAEGTGESLSHGREEAAKSLRRGALDTQYGTKSSLKSGGTDAGAPGKGGGQDAAAPNAASDTSKQSDRVPEAPNPGSSEDSSGAERDTMTSSRPGSGR
jgi:hypothetical protein